MSSQAQFTKNLSSRQPSAEENKIIQDIIALYQCRPSEQAYSHYAETAQFRDPVSIAKGKAQIQAQFNGMPKLFSSSETQGPPHS
jgi:ketosteroid isomerase-like protein